MTSSPILRLSNICCLLGVTITLYGGTFVNASPPSSTSTAGMVVRIRLPTGTVEKIQIEDGQDETLTMSDILRPFDLVDDDDTSSGSHSVILGDKILQSDSTKTLKECGVKHGTILTVPSSSKSRSSSTTSSSSSSTLNGRRRLRAGTSGWDPYPDIAKDYQSEYLKSRNMKSYSDVAQLQSSLHIVEPQKEGPVKRIYLCRRSAERFYSNGIDRGTSTKKRQSSRSTGPTTTPRVGLLLGTVVKERSGGSVPTKARTSLSSTTEEDEFCQVIKVQAVWEPPGQKPISATSFPRRVYDAELASQMLPGTVNNELKDHSRVLTIADRLGIQPVGWIFTTGGSSPSAETNDSTSTIKTAGTDARRLSIAERRKKMKSDSEEENDRSNNLESSDEEENDMVPIDAVDVLVGAKLQIENMRRLRNSNDIASGKDRSRGDKFVTVSMDSKTGGTEAFQLSSETIQMVHEGVFADLVSELVESSSRTSKRKAATDLKIIPTQHPVIVDGTETTKLDSVLCLINTALLSHVGTFSGNSSGNTVKKINGDLTNKTKKSILAAIEKGDDRALLTELCDFNVLLALDTALDDEDMSYLCDSVRKWSRGQKQGTVIRSNLKLKLRSLVE